VLRSPAAQRCNVLSSAPYSIGDEGRDATQEDVDLYGDRALLSFLTLEHRAFLACQRTSLAVRVIVLAIFFVPLGVINPIDASWLYSWLAFYVCLEVIAVLSERSATKKVQQRLASLIKYGSKHRLLRLSEVTELPLVEIGRRLVFGAVLGADAAVLMFALYPGLFPGADFGEVLYVGSAVGAAVSQLLERWLATLISPMARRTKRYLTLVELALARGKGTLSEAHANALREKAQNEYFHDDTASRAKGRLRSRFEIE
jgi:hypothetical protein